MMSMMMVTMKILAVHIWDYLCIYFVRKAICYCRPVFVEDIDAVVGYGDDGGVNDDACPSNFLLFIYLFC